MTKKCFWSKICFWTIIFLDPNFFLAQCCFRPNSFHFSLGLIKTLSKLNTLDLSFFCIFLVMYVVWKEIEFNILLPFLQLLALRDLNTTYFTWTLHRRTEKVKIIVDVLDRHLKDIFTYQKVILFSLFCEVCELFLLKQF